MTNIDQAFTKLETAASVFKAALYEFRKTYDPDTVGIDEFAEQIDNVLFEIDAELQEEGV